MIKIPSSSSPIHLSPIMSTHSPSLWKILSETRRIITSHGLHFLTLSALFLLPLSITSTVYLFLKPQTISLHTLYDQSFFSMSTPPTENPPVLKPILMTLSCIIFSLCANSSISCSTFTAFNNEPMKLTRSLRAIITSFFPLLATLFVTQAIVGVISFAFLFLMMLPYGVLALNGFENRYFIVFGITVTVILVMSVFYLVIEWCLSDAVVVLESSWGFAPLRRSSYLIKGTRKVALSMYLLLLVVTGILQVWCFNLAANAGEVSKVWTFAQMLVFVVLFTVLSLYGTVAKTVLYIYSKAAHGEMAGPIDLKEYVLVPIAESS